VTGRASRSSSAPRLTGLLKLQGAAGLDQEMGGLDNLILDVLLDPFVLGKRLVRNRVISINVSARSTHCPASLAIAVRPVMAGPYCFAGLFGTASEENFAIRSLANPAQKTQTAKSVHSWADYLATRAVTTIRLSYSTTATAPARCHDSFFVMWIPLRIRTRSSFRFV
jgi:hypothetical protein